MGRRTSESAQEDRRHLGIHHTYGKGGHLLGDGTNGGDAHALALTLGTASSNSVAMSAEENNTHLSTSSAGNHSFLSTSDISGRSTARTSAMSDSEDPPSADTTPPHPQPAITVLDLVSNSAGASALPDGFGFSMSRRGTFIAVTSSSNIWLLNASMLPRLFARTLEIRRKPVALDILDDGTLLAVLSKPTQVDIYNMNGEDGKIEKQRTLLLENEASTMALSPEGLILATGHDNGIEIFSIGPGVSESCRRTAVCPPMDSLQFSDDGRTLLCTSPARRSSVSTLFSVSGAYDGPFTEEGFPIEQEVDKAWTTQILFPEKVNTASQATLLSGSMTGQANELFAFNHRDRRWGIYDHASQSFTAKNVSLPNERVYQRLESLGDTVPAVSLEGKYVALGLGSWTTQLFLYCLGDPSSSESLEARRAEPLQPCFTLPVLERPDGRLHQKIGLLRWVDLPDTPNIQRLVAVGNVTCLSDNTNVPVLTQSSTGVVVVLDFDPGKSETRETTVPVKVTYELDNILPAERLPEEDIDFEREVELVRTRTVAQRRAAEMASSSNRLSRVMPTRAHTSATRSRDVERRSSVAPDEDSLAPDEAQALLEVPYDHSQPRSQSSLARAATVAAASSANRRHLRALPERPLEYRRADGLREIPHESDADNWVPPPPPYTKEVDPKTSVPFPGPSSRSAPRPASSPAPRGRTVSQNGSAVPDPGPSATLPALPFSTMMPSRRDDPRATMYSSPTGVLAQSASDLRLITSQARPPLLLHSSTYPAPSSSRRRSSVVSPRGSVSHSHQSPDQQTAYQANAAARTRSSLRPETLPFSNPFTSGRRGSAPDVGLHRNRTMLPRLATRTDNIRGHRGPMSAHPLSAPVGAAYARQARSVPNLLTNDQEKQRSPLRKFLDCVVM